MSISIPPLCVSPGRALIVAGLLKPEHAVEAAEKVAYTQIARGTFPFPLISFPSMKRKYLVRFSDIENILAQKPATVSTAAEALESPRPRRARGRPRKAAGGTSRSASAP